ncbi:hypothetical protein pb186bvf_016497 [Paramecium bursaria]
MGLSSKIYKILDQMRDNVERSSGKRNENLDTGLLIELRKSHRELYTTLENNRKQNQIEKDVLDKETINSECLEYQKNQLKTNIEQFRNVNAESFIKIRRQLDLHNKEPLKDKALILKVLEDELQVRKSKKIQLEQINDKYTQLETKYKQQEHQFFVQLPEQLKQIQGQLQPILSLFELPQLYLPSQQNYYSELPQPLLSIYQKLYSKCMNLEIVKTQLLETQFKLSEYEIKVTINEGYVDQNVLDYLQVDVKEFNENIFPLIFHIKYFKKLDKIVFQVDRKNTLSSEELFCGLVKGDSGEPLIVNAQNDEELNMNQKYLSFNWANSLAGLSLSAQEFYDLLLKRILNIQLRNEFPLSLPGQKVSPRLNLKYFGSTKLARRATILGHPFNLQEHIKQKDTLLVDDETLKSYVQLNYRYEGQSEHLHDCYKLILEGQNKDYELGIIIPLSYPQQDARYILFDNEMTKFEWFQILQNISHLKNQQSQKQM